MNYICSLLYILMNPFPKDFNCHSTPQSHALQCQPHAIPSIHLIHKIKSEIHWITKLANCIVLLAWFCCLECVFMLCYILSYSLNGKLRVLLRKENALQLPKRQVTLISHFILFYALVFSSSMHDRCLFWFSKFYTLLRYT